MKKKWDVPVCKLHYRSGNNNKLKKSHYYNKGNQRSFYGNGQCSRQLKSIAILIR